jgi:hypothetical protein
VPDNHFHTLARELVQERWLLAKVRVVVVELGHRSHSLPRLMAKVLVNFLSQHTN